MHSLTELKQEEFRLKSYHLAIVGLLCFLLGLVSGASMIWLYKFLKNKFSKKTIKTPKEAIYLQKKKKTEDNHYESMDLPKKRRSENGSIPADRATNTPQVKVYPKTDYSSRYHTWGPKNRPGSMRNGHRGTALSRKSSFNSLKRNQGKLTPTENYDRLDFLTQKYKFEDGTMLC